MKKIYKVQCRANLKLSNFTLIERGNALVLKIIIEKKNVVKKELKIYFLLSETGFDRKQRKNNVCRQVVLFYD